MANLLMRRKTVALPCEDVVSCAVNAARPLLDRLGERERETIELLVVGTEVGDRPVQVDRDLDPRTPATAPHLPPVRGQAGLLRGSGGPPARHGADRDRLPRGRPRPGDRL
ncbi:hypothetical protein ACRAWF_30565 [Streptomyces sp. L7]